MATNNGGDLLALVCAASTVGKSGYAYKINSSGQWAICAAAGEQVHAIMTEEVAAGKAAAGQYSGKALVIFGGTVNPGDRVRVDANGKIVAITATSVSGATVVGSHCFGVCTKGGANNEYGEILIQPMGVVPTTNA